MREFEITFASFIGAVKHHWILMLSSLVLFSLLGAGTGYWHANRGSADADGDADALIRAEVTELTQDAEYYTNVQSTLNLAYQNACTYVKSITDIPSLTNDERLKLEKQLKALTLFEKEKLKPIADRLYAPDAVYVLDDYIPKLIETYENELVSVRRNLIVSEQAVKIIEAMDAPSVDNENSLANYNALLTQAYDYGNYLLQQEIYTERLEKLRNDANSISTSSREIGRLQKEAVRQLNQITEEISNEADALAKAHVLNIGTQYDSAGTLSVIVTHTHRAATPQDNFLIVWIFCTLTGMCVGAFLALCREAGAFSRGKLNKEQRIK